MSAEVEAPADAVQRIYYPPEAVKSFGQDLRQEISEPQNKIAEGITLFQQLKPGKQTSSLESLQANFSDFTQLIQHMANDGHIIVEADRTREDLVILPDTESPPLDVPDTETSPEHVILFAEAFRHRFRTLLTVIRGNASLIYRFTRTPVSQEAEEQIAIASDEITTVITNFAGAVTEEGENAKSQHTVPEKKTIYSVK